MDMWQAIMVVVAILGLFITFVNAITNERLTLHVLELHFCMNQYTCKRLQSYIFKYPAPLHKTLVAYSYNQTKQ